jgi:hypothetical protein
MPRGHQVELGSRTFPTKGIAKTYIRTEILRAYPIGEPISDPEHVAVLMDVLRRKENAAEKIGSGINYFYVDLTSRFRSYVRADARTIVIHHRSANEVDVDFGYERVIDDSSDVDYAKEALRHAVQDRRDDFKFSHFLDGATPLDQHGTPIESHEHAEIRYVDPDWGQLTSDFAASEGGWVVLETHSGDGVEAQIGRRLISDYLAGKWRDYYDANANPVLSRKRGT